MCPSWTLLLLFLAPRYRFRRTGQALLGLKPCGKRSRGCLPKEPYKSPEIRVPAFTVAFSLWRRRLETRDRTLTPERVCPTYSVQDGNSRFGAVICQRDGFSSFPGSKACILSDPDLSIFEEAIEVHVGGDGLPIPSPVFRAVDRSPGLHQGLRSGVSVGTLPRDQTSKFLTVAENFCAMDAPPAQLWQVVLHQVFTRVFAVGLRSGDNSTVVAYVNKQGGTVSGALCLLASRQQGIYQVSTRTHQCPGRHPQPSRASSRDRVVFPPAGGEVTASRVGQSVDRPLCDVPQRETAPLLLACPGSSDRLRGCVSPSLGRPGSLRVKSLSSGRSGDRPCPRVVACRDDSGRTPLAGEGVVSRSPASTDPTTSRPALVGQPAPAAPLQSLPPRRPCVEPSNVVTLKRHFRKSGFSGRAARVLSGCLRDSSSRLYQSQWQIFCGWCRGRVVAPVNATVPVVVDFLIHLRHDKGLSISAVEGYSSALNSVLALKGRGLASSREITMLLRSFSRSVNPVELRPPEWDVALVLQNLTGAPYEPLRTCDECFLAQKTLFLLALASAKRIGELHALSYHVSHTRGWAEVSFSFVPGFVAKTQDPFFPCSSV